MTGAEQAAAPAAGPAGSQEVRRRDSLVVRAMLYLGASIAIFAALSVASFYYLQRAWVEERIWRRVTAT